MHNPSTPRSRGFTLVELLIAMVAGVAVSAAAYILAKNSTQVFQQEARMSGAQFSATMGMNRLITDISRASFLSTPNIQSDPSVCKYGTYPNGLSVLAGVQILYNGSSAPVSTASPNSLSPDAIIIGGSFDTTEQFPTRSISSDGSIYLQLNSNAMLRTLNGLTTFAQKNDKLVNQIFKVGRFLRLVDSEGKLLFSEITNSVYATDESSMVVKVDPATFPSKNSYICGYSGLGIGLLVNPVSRVRYELRSLAGDANYGDLVASPGTEEEKVLNDAGRTELVRMELGPDGTPLTDTNGVDIVELIAEFGVDLKFGVSRYIPATDTTTSSIERDDIPMMETEYVAPLLLPQRVESVQVRLSVRNRTPERDVALDTRADGALYRFDVFGGTSTKPNRFARVRTYYSEVALMNQMGVTW